MKRRIGAALLFLIVALCLSALVVPRLLDRIYYRGPVSDHFDGERFFNPGERGGPSAEASRAFFTGRFRGAYAQWPETVAVKQTMPPRRVEGEAMRVTWIGHATVLVQTQGLNILTDPVWSDRASPFSFVGPKRVRAPGVRFEDLPKIDLVLVSHNHYDHMDLATLKRLWRRDRPAIVVPLGNDTILRRAGVPSVALDWGHMATLTEDGIELNGLCDGPCPGDKIYIVAEPSHHWSSRWGSDRNRALWSAFTLMMPGGYVYFAGDTGWGDGSWVKDAAAHGPFRLAIIPIGAYEPRDFMRFHHIDPEEAVRVFEALNPARALAIHWGTFQLTFEAIDQPRERLEMLKREQGIAPDRFVATEAGQSFDVPPL